MKYLYRVAEWITFFFVMVAVIIGTILACFIACAFFPYIATRRNIRRAL